jgi:hypothetical protein
MTFHSTKCLHFSGKQYRVFISLITKKFWPIMYVVSIRSVFWSMLFVKLVHIEGLKMKFDTSSLLYPF